MGGSFSSDSKALQIIKNEVKSAPVVVYTKPHCQYCTRAKKELNDRGIDFLEKNIEAKAHEGADVYQEYVTSLISYTKQKTVPQIFICGRFIGGYTEMHNLGDDIQRLISKCAKDSAAGTLKAHL